MVWLDYLKVFVTGGTICLIAQLLINLTKLTSTRILVLFLLTGVVLEVLGVYKYIKEFGKCGATIPILGFGSSLARGAIEAASDKGILGAISGGHENVVAGLSSVIFFSFIAGLFAKSKTK